MVSMVPVESAKRHAAGNAIKNEKPRNRNGCEAFAVCP
ncbi:hypothetical protein BIFADO_01317 [Bifidobacterium adolescentis L2-32]|uniref:Uncharacterized protein n=1 Tax=Bifidobacterium adolescentis L2-32 TaxID=411481 RepID=A7A640_BIFAD|nr:hypothetical protein BIFADO_01317 [Bifidobacterium adolescentis L2-32]